MSGTRLSGGIQPGIVAGDAISDNTGLAGGSAPEEAVSEIIAAGPIPDAVSDSPEVEPGTPLEVKSPGGDVYKAQIAELLAQAPRASSSTNVSKKTPRTVIFSSWDDVKIFTDEIDQLLAKADTPQKLEAVLERIYELTRYFESDETHAQHSYLQDMSNQELRAKYLLLAMAVANFKEWETRINLGLAAHAEWIGIDKDRHAAMLRRVQGAKNKPQINDAQKLERLTLAIDAYGAAAQPSIIIGGNKTSLPAAVALLESSDREECEKIWRAIAQGFATKKDGVFKSMADVLLETSAIAKERGDKKTHDFVKSYQGRSHSRVDHDFIDSARIWFAPILRKIREEKAKDLGMAEKDLMPWDVKRTPVGRAPLKPYQNTEEMVHKLIIAANRIDKRFGGVIASMRDNGQLLLTVDPNRYARPYFAEMARENLSVISAQPTGSLGSLSSLAHELGHAFHFAFGNHADNYQASISGVHHEPGQQNDLIETFSMIFEILLPMQTEVFFGEPEDQKRAQIMLVERAVEIICDNAVSMAFEEWLYNNPKDAINEDKFRRKWFDLQVEFGTAEPHWEQYTVELTSRYDKLADAMGRTQNYTHSYGQNTIGSLWALAHFQEAAANRRVSKMADRLMAGMQAGNSQPVYKVWANMGHRYSFERNYVRRLASFTRQRLEALFQQGSLENG